MTGSAISFARFAPRAIKDPRLPSGRVQLMDCPRGPILVNLSIENEFTAVKFTISIGGNVIAGFAIGFLIGLVTGTVFLLLLKSANEASEKGVSIVKLTSEILAIPTFWFGGPWLSTKMLKDVSMDTLINPYLISLAAVFSLISLYPAARWIIHLGEQFGAKPE